MKAASRFIVMRNRMAARTARQMALDLRLSLIPREPHILRSLFELAEERGEARDFVAVGTKESVRAAAIGGLAPFTIEVLDPGR